MTENINSEKAQDQVNASSISSKDEANYTVHVHHEKVVENRKADITLNLLETYEAEAGELTPELEKKLVIKLWLIIFPVVFAVNFMLFLDKNAMGYASLLGMFKDLDLDQQKYNNLQTVLYVGYLVGQIPSHLVFQRIPLRIYVSGTIMIWSFVTLIQLACKNFSQLAATRFFLGFFESGVTPCIVQTIAMWFTPAEQAVVNPIFWISCLAQGIPGGLLSYGIEHITTVSPWKVYWSIIGGLTFLLSLTTFVIYPDNPATHRFFTTTERVHIIKRIKAATNSSIEQKVVKKEQVVEAFKDPITWLFALFVFCLMFENNISFQSAIIYQNLGLNTLNSTLVSVASSGWSTVISIIGSITLNYFKSQTAHVGTAFCMVAFLGGILTVSLPLHLSKGYGILAGIFLTNATGVAFIGAFSWAQSSAAGYTKRLVRTVVWSVSYAIVNLFASQFWHAKDKPRYYRAWIVIIIFSWVIAPTILQVIRYILNKRNIERRQYIQDIKDGKIEDDSNFVTYTDDEGNEAKKEVDVSMLDLTDLQNKKFIYPL